MRLVPHSTRRDDDKPVALPVERTKAGHVDVLDHVLDKGIVIDGWMRVRLAGLDVVTVEMRVVVASIETYLKHADALAHVPPCSHAEIEPARPPRRGRPRLSIPAGSSQLKVPES